MKEFTSTPSDLSSPRHLPRRPRRQGKHSSLLLLRLRARTPRVLLGALVVVLCVAGVRSIFSGRPASADPVSTASHYDLGAAAFAQSFTSAYLTWGPGLSEGERIVSLKPFLAQGIEADAGLAPAPETSDSVTATQVAEENRAGQIIDVLVVAETSEGTQYVSVPVARDERGLLSIASYPALVGPPATDTAEPALSLSPVEDEGLETVVSRGLRNYLTGEVADLRADLMSGAIVSLPSQTLAVTDTDTVDWLVRGRTVAVQLEAEDRQGAEMTLTYQVGVVRRGRWYINSIQDDPTLEGGM